MKHPSAEMESGATALCLLHLANEGVVKVLPVKERTWPNNASLNAYLVADLTSMHKTLIARQQPALSEQTGEASPLEKETLLLKIQYADQEIAQLLTLAEGEKVVVYRERKRLADTTVVAISDLYAPFWFADVLPDLEQPGSDAYQLMARIGKTPARWIETVEVIQARSGERILFERSPDDPTPFLKLQRQSFDANDSPLAVEFLTLDADAYRLQYSCSV